MIDYFCKGEWVLYNVKNSMIVSIMKNSFWKKSFNSTYYHRGRNSFRYPHELAWLPWFQSTGVQSDSSHYTSNRCYTSEGPGCCAPFQNTAAHNIKASKGQTRQARVYYYERLFDTLSISLPSPGVQQH